MNRTAYIDKIWSRLPFDITKAQLSLILDSFLEEIPCQLKAGHPVKLRNFGAFNLRRRSAVRRYLPGRNELTSFPASNTVKFTPSPSLIKELNK